MKRLILALALLLSIVFSVSAQPTPHSITVQWTYTQGADLATGFNVYRGTTSGGPYALLNPASAAGGSPVPLPITTLNFSDITGAGGTKYFYVVTAVDVSGFESAYSNEVSGTFLANPAAPGGVILVIK